MKLLQVDSTIFDAESVSRELTAKIVQALTVRHTNLEVTHLDLAATPLGHLTQEHLAAAQGAPVTGQLAADLAAGQHALDAFLAADIVVLGAPMYNFGVPSQLKAWFDRLATPGQTFRYGEHGPEGLCGGKKLIIASARGGIFSNGSPLAAMDHQEGHVTSFFAFLGITDITIVRAEGLALGPENRAKALSDAELTIATLAV